MIAALAFVRRITGMLSLKGWLAVALLTAFLLFGAYCAHRAAEGERERQAAEAFAIANKSTSPLWPGKLTSHSHLIRAPRSIIAETVSCIGRLGQRHQPDSEATRFDTPDLSRCNRSGRSLVG